MAIEKVGDWTKAARILSQMHSEYMKALRRGLHRTGNMVRTAVVKGIRDQAPGGQKFVPITALTARRKGSSKALIEHGDLMNSITYKVEEGKLAVFIGILRATRGKHKDTGAPYMVDIADVHEFGRIIKVTPKMRAYFRGAFGINLASTTTHIIIPARPFLRPTMEAEKDKVVKEFQRQVQAVIRG